MIQRAEQSMIRVFWLRSACWAELHPSCSVDSSPYLSQSSIPDAYQLQQSLKNKIDKASYGVLFPASWSKMLTATWFSSRVASDTHKAKSKRPLVLQSSLERICIIRQFDR